MQVLLRGFAACADFTGRLRRTDGRRQLAVTAWNRAMQVLLRGFAACAGRTSNTSSKAINTLPAIRSRTNKCNGSFDFLLTYLKNSSKC